MPDTLIANDAAIISADTQMSLLALTGQYATTLQTLNDICTDLKKVVHMLAEEYEQDDFYEPIRLLANLEWTLDKHGRRFALLFTPVSLTSIAFSFQGVTGTMTYAAGWSLLNEPDRAIFTPPAGMNQVVLLKYTNWFSGSAA